MKYYWWATYWSLILQHFNIISFRQKNETFHTQDCSNDFSGVIQRLGLSKRLFSLTIISHETVSIVCNSSARAIICLQNNKELTINVVKYLEYQNLRQCATVSLIHLGIKVMEQRVAIIFSWRTNRFISKQLQEKTIKIQILKSGTKNIKCYISNRHMYPDYVRLLGS